MRTSATSQQPARRCLLLLRLLLLAALTGITPASAAPAGDAAPQAAGQVRSAEAAESLETAQSTEAAAAPRDGATQPAGGTPSSDQERDRAIEELRRRIDILAAEIEQLRSGEEPAPQLSDARRRTLGLAPSAAAAYGSRGISLAGYGEMLFENPADVDQTGVPTGGGSRLDFLRVILYAGYRFGDRFVFNSEIELEHTNEASVEFAYLDYLINDAVTLRGGLVLIPLGFVNELHEPNVFLGARRSETERVIIPTTWRENGVGVLGSVGRISYRGYLVNGMDAAGFSASGLRGGRQKGSKAKAADLAFAGRVDFSPVPGAVIGAALYAGGSDQGELTSDGRVLDVATTVAEVHGQLQLRGFDVRGLLARATLGDVPGLNDALGLTGRRGVGDTMRGGYIQMGYDLLSQRGTSVGLTPYYRFEAVDTQAEVPPGFLRDPVRDVTSHTVGFQLQPIYNVVVKVDYQWLRNRARTGRNQFNIAMGYAF